MAFTGLAYGATGTVDLRAASSAGRSRQAKVVVHVEGKLKLNADGKDVRHLPLRVDAELAYSERVLATAKGWTTVRLARCYQSAEAKIRLHESDLIHRLRPERETVLVDTSPKRAVVFSPLGPLAREELDLIEIPASGLALEALLPPRVLTVGSQWTLDDATVARLLGLEAISQQDVACTLDAVEEDLAIVSLAGKSAGAIGGVSSDVELKGKLNFDLQKRAVTWLTLAIKENRAIGHAQPGFETIATLRMVVAPVASAPELSDQALQGLSLAADAGQTLVEFTSEAGGFQLNHDRRWSAMLERNDLTVLRLIDRGDLIAQCNISPRPALGKDEQLTLAGFQDDVKRVLGKNFEQITEASEETAENGLRVLRVVVAGSVGELPIQWTYYHLSNNEGRRASLVFTIETSLLERFATIDRELIGNFRFLTDKNPSPAGEPPPRTSARPPYQSDHMKGVLR